MDVAGEGEVRRCLFIKEVKVEPFFLRSMTRYIAAYLP